MDSEKEQADEPVQRDSNASDTKRRKLLAELRKKLRKVNCEATDVDEEVTDEESRPPGKKKSKTMLGNKLALKQERAIELGWIHEGQQVRKQTGGGTRKVTVQRDATAIAIIDYATQLFFPDGVSKRGTKLEEVELELCDFSLNKASQTQTVGEAYEKERPAGIMRWYLSTKLKLSSTKANPPEAISSSAGTERKVNHQPKYKPIENLHIPLSEQPETSTMTGNEKRTTPTPEKDSPATQTEKHIVAKPPKSKEDMVPLPPNVPHDNGTSSGLYPVLEGEVCVSNEPLNVSYVKEIESAYSGNKSKMTANSRSQCIHLTDEEGNPPDPSVVYDPLRNGYKISKLAKANKIFVNCSSTSNQDDAIEFPVATQAKSPDPFLILHHPDEVWGIEEGKLVLAVVSQNHNNAAVSYEWLSNGQPVYTGGCVFMVEQPGIYSCVLKAALQDEGGNLREITRISNVVQVVKIPCITAMSSHERHEEISHEEFHFSAISCDFKNEINHGSFGEVFRGSYKENAVAIKRIKMKRGKRPDKFILNEARVHQQIAHKNIVRFIGTYMNQTCVFVVTELIDGPNMEDWIYLHDDEVDMPHKQLSVAIGVLEGIAYLHEHEPQIIHQDIKPANILLDKHLSPKICDLGLARVRSFDVSSTTSGVHAVGTPEYMSPETLLSGKKGTVSSDIWSLGITLLEWFCKRDAWNLHNQEEEPVIYIRQCMQEKKMPTLFESCNLPLLVPCLSYQPSERPTARHLLQQFMCPTCSCTVMNTLSGT